MGIQTYWGGQAVKIILGAVIGPKYAYMTNRLPLSANVDTCSLVSFFIFLAIFCPMLLIPPEKLQTPLKVSRQFLGVSFGANQMEVAFVMIVCNIFGMLIWSVRTAHGPGDLINSPSTESGSVLGWNVVYGIQAILGLWSGGIVGQSGTTSLYFDCQPFLTLTDWTRYATTPNASLFGQGVTCPLTIIVTALCGLIITSASEKIYGAYFWNPFELLLHIQSVSMTPAARAGTFFSGLCFLTSQMALCIVLNAISTGMDMAALCPRWINIRRGCFLLTIIAVAICPWNYVNNVTTFITVLSGWSIFLSGMTGILIFDYFLVRKGQLHKGDMYKGNKSSAYWYTAGFNWRAIVAWIMGVWPLLRTSTFSILLANEVLTFLIAGFVRRVQGVSDGNGWDHVYDLSYFFGFFVSGIFHWVLHTILPAKRQTGSSPFEMKLHRTREHIDGEAPRPYVDSTSSHDGEVIEVGKEKSSV